MRLGELIQALNSAALQSGTDVLNKQVMFVREQIGYAISDVRVGNTVVILDAACYRGAMQLVKE